MSRPASLVFQAVDGRDSPALSGCFARANKITFGKQSSLEGQDTVEAETAGFVSHRQKLINPADSIWTVGSDGLIHDGRVLFDTTPVIA